MRDQEQAVVELEVGRRHGEQHSRHAADDERNHEADRPQHRHVKRMRPPYIVNNQLKIFTPVGTAMIIDHDAEEAR